VIGFYKVRRIEVKSAKNETLQTIQRRRSIRLFMKEEVSDDDIHILLRAANEAPSAHNQQSWKFMVLKERKRDG
jgi:nitroreductase